MLHREEDCLFAIASTFRRQPVRQCGRPLTYCIAPYTDSDEENKLFPDVVQDSDGSDEGVMRAQDHRSGQSRGKRGRPQQLESSLPDQLLPDSDVDLLDFHNDVFMQYIDRVKQSRQQKRELSHSHSSNWDQLYPIEKADRKHSKLNNRRTQLSLHAINKVLNLILCFSINRMSFTGNGSLLDET